MNKRWKGYFTVEAAFIMPIILFLYLIIILTALFLYCRCAISQDNFLLGIRAAGFSYGEDNYGEVIYGEYENNVWTPDGYIQERLSRKRTSYPFFPTQTGTYREKDESVWVQAGQKGSKVLIEKSVQKLNPVKIIREGRKSE